MIDNFLGPDESRHKNKRIEPLDKPAGKSIHQLAAEHEAKEINEVTELDQAQPQPADVETIYQDENSDEPVFEQPEEVAAKEVDTTTQPIDQDKPSVSSKKSNFLSWRWPLSKKWTIIAASFTLLLVGGGVTFAYMSQPKDQGGVHISKKGKFVPKITTVASTLSGLQVDPSVNKRPVTGVMIENSTDARPQSGLDQAGVVFEAIAEGGITRFMALFQDTQPDYIGPVRSARPYYVQWCMSFDCALAHAGGSPEALQNIRDWGTKDLDDTAGIFWRVSGRFAPHNLYSSIAKLNELETSKGYGAATFTGLVRKADKPYRAPATAPSGTTQPKVAQDARTAASSIDLAISSGAFNSHYDYDAGTNSYKRSQAGAPHMVTDAAGKETQVVSKVVVALVMPYSIASDKHSQYGVVGSGQAYVFQDGTVTAATWSKADTAAPLKLLDSANQPLAINAGQTWFTALSANNLVTYR